MAFSGEINPGDSSNTSWHVTVRGIRERKPFLRRVDKADLLDRFRNHLSPVPTRDRFRRSHVKLIGLVEALAFCVMDNHLHSILLQLDPDGIRRLMQRVLPSFVREYNRQHNRQGPLFDARHESTLLDDKDPDHIRHAIGYVHLNHPIEQLDYEWGSHQVLTGERACSWIDRDRTLAVFGGVPGYVEFMNSYGPKIVREKLVEWGLPPESHPYRPCSVKDFTWYHPDET